MSITSQFQSTLPVWGGTLPSGFSMAFSMMFQSTLPVWGGTAVHRLDVGGGPGVSIHPPRVGRDSTSSFVAELVPGFNPPSPCGEGLALLVGVGRVLRFNPPSPCGEGQQKFTKILCKLLR